MILQINGEPREVPTGTELSGLLGHLGLPGAGVLIEHNGLALHKSEWGTCQLAEGDQLEIIRIVAGG